MTDFAVDAYLKGEDTASLSMDAIIKARTFYLVFDSQIEQTGNTTGLALDAKIIETFTLLVVDAKLSKAALTVTSKLDAKIYRGKSLSVDALFVATDRQHKSVAVGVRSKAWRTALFKQTASIPNEIVSCLMDAILYE